MNHLSNQNKNNQEATVALRVLRSAAASGTQEATLCTRLSFALLQKNRNASMHYLQRALLLDTDFSLGLGPLMLNLARSYGRQCAFAESLQLFRQYVERQPNDHVVRSEYASMLLAHRDIAESLQQFQALPADFLATQPAVRKDYAMALLCTPGHLSDGLYLWEARLQCWTLPLDIKGMPELTKQQLATYTHDKPDGQCLQVLVLDEQGIGDTLQFFRYVVLLAQLYPKWQFSFCCKSVCRSFFDFTKPHLENLRLLSSEQLPAFMEVAHVKTYLCSLPWLLDIRTVTAEGVGTGWLQAPPAHKRNHWQTWLQKLQHGGAQRKKIGFCLRGTNSTSVEKNLDFAMVVEQCFLAFHSQADFVCLNRRQDYATEIERADWYDFVHFLELDASDEPFADTMALIEQMDLVISVDTSIAHLAANMGRPVWLLLGALSDWRWHHELPAGGGTPWYSDMRMFRAAVPNKFSEILPAVKNALESWVKL